MPLRSNLRRKVAAAFAAAEVEETAPTDALFDEDARSGELRRIPLSKITRRPDQPRQSMDPEALEELTQSIRDHGVLQPIRVRSKADGEYEIIAGERRWTAAERADLRDIPAVVVTADDDEAYVEALIENIQREDLNSVDRAQALKRLRVNLGSQSWEEVGRKVGITRRHVYHLLNITRLPEPIQEDIRVGDLTEKHGRALLAVRSHPELQTKLWERIHKDQLSGDATLALAKKLRPAPPPTGADQASSAKPGQLTAAVERLLDALGRASAGELRSATRRLTELRQRLAEVIPAPTTGDRRRGSSPR